MAPAFETVGSTTRVIETVSAEIQTPPFTIDHSKVLVPMLIPETLLVGEVGLEIVPVPVINVQVPVPTLGTLP